MVAALKCVDAAFIMRNLGQLECGIRFAHKLFKNLPELYGKPIICSENCELVIIPDVEELTSTTQIVRNIQGRIIQAPQ